MATWRPLEFLGSRLQGADLSEHTKWMNEGSLSMCLCMSSFERQTGTCAGGSHAMRMPQVVRTGCVASGGRVELEAVVTCSISSQLQCDATTSPLLWSPRHWHRSLADQTFTEDPECSLG